MEGSEDRANQTGRSYWTYLRIVATRLIVFDEDEAMSISEKDSNEISPGSWMELKRLTLDPKQDERLRLESLQKLGAIRAPDGSIPDAVFKSILEILWDFLAERQDEFLGEGKELKSIFRSWNGRLAPKQLGFVLGIHRCIRRGSFVVFWACLGGNTGRRSERLVKESRWREFKSVIEEYERKWHAQAME